MRKLKSDAFTYLNNTFYVKKLDVAFLNYIQRKLHKLKSNYEAQDIYRRTVNNLMVINRCLR